MPHVKVVYSNALGWRVQADLLHQVATQGDGSVKVELIPYSSPKITRPFLKDTYGIGLPKRLNLVTSVAVAGSVLCRNVARFEEGDRVVFLGSNALGLLAHAPATLSPVLVADMTAALAVRLFGAHFTRRDVAEEKRLFNRCRKIFAMSTACARSLVDDYGFSPDRVGVYLPPVRPGPRAQPSPDGRVRVGFVGGDFKRKGGGLLLAAYRASSLAGLCDLVIVSEKCEPLDEPGITVHGRLPHDVIMRTILPNIDIFCLPTLQDCSGVAIAEALFAGLPVIATDVPGIADLVSDGETGIVVPPGQAEPIGNAIAQLARDAAFRARLSHQALAFAQENFRAEVKLAQLVAEFR